MRDPPGMSDARWTCNPLPGDADSPARVTRPARPRHRAARADGPGALEMGDRAAVPGQLPPSRPLWARPVGSELRARYKPRTQQMAQPSSPGASHHASLGPLISPRPSWPPQDPPQLLGEQSGQGTLFPTAPTPPPAGQAAERGRRALGGGHLDPPGAPQVAMAPRNRSQTKASRSLGMGRPVRVRPWPCWLGDRVISGSPVPLPFQGPQVQSHRGSEAHEQFSGAPGSCGKVSGSAPSPSAGTWRPRPNSQGARSRQGSAAPPEMLRPQCSDHSLAQDRHGPAR